MKSDFISNGFWDGKRIYIVQADEPKNLGGSIRLKFLETK